MQTYADRSGDIVVWLRNIEEAVHFVPLEPEHKGVLNNQVDYHVWNVMND